jgi:hypothetical protein
VNIDGLQNTLPVGLNRDPLLSTCCTQPQVWDSTSNSCVDPLVVTCITTPSLIGTNTQVMWNVGYQSGGTGLINCSDWQGADQFDSTNYPCYASQTYTTTGTKNAAVTVVSGGQTVYQTCTVQVNECSSTPPTPNSKLCTDGPVTAPDDAVGTLET